RAERGGSEVGGRKRFAAALVVPRRVSVESAAGGFMEGNAMQLALVFAGDFDHRPSVRIFPGLATPLVGTCRPVSPGYAGGVCWRACSACAGVSTTDFAGVGASAEGCPGGRPRSGG